MISRRTFSVAWFAGFASLCGCDYSGQRELDRLVEKVQHTHDRKEPPLSSISEIDLSVLMDRKVKGVCLQDITLLNADDPRCAYRADTTFYSWDDSHVLSVFFENGSVRRLSFSLRAGKLTVLSPPVPDACIAGPRLPVQIDTEGNDIREMRIDVARMTSSAREMCNVRNTTR